MSNEFIKYLNSMNNASSNNQNALAESQVLSDYYSKVRVERKIGDYVFDLLFNNKPQAIILTGHAGDGKTSILVQILEKLGYFKDGKKPLRENEIFKEFLYVKDMSELNEQKQEELLKEIIQAPNKRLSSLLISNTGPMINTFRRIINDECESDNFEMTLLDNIDRVVSDDIEIKIDGSVLSFKTVNIANIDNSYFIEEIIHKLTNQELWQPCIECARNQNCPICNNYNDLLNNKERIIKFIKRLYIYFAENESRLTIRQMLAHITYTITGNLECKEIHSMNDIQDNLFKYSFANQFFGYRGKHIRKDSFNIKAIKELDKIKLDEKSIMDIDYKLFVKEEFDYFDESIKELLEHMLRINMESLSLDNSDSVLLRRAFRRYYILFSKISIDEFNNLIDELFSEIFSIYYTLISQESMSKNLEISIQDIVFKALYRVFLGVHPKAEDNRLYLTLKKDIESEQNVQLIQGELDKYNIKIIRSDIEDKIEETVKKFIPIIKFGSTEEMLDYQKLNYFNKLNEGQVFTHLEPNFTFGLNKLKTDLLKEYKYDKDDISLLLIKNSRLDKVNIYVDDENINVTR